MPIYAITVKHPWLWCILHSTKRIENRNWTPPSRIVGTRVYLHSSQEFDHEGVEFCKRSGVQLPTDYHFGCIEGSCIIGGTIDYSDNHWFQGPIGWVLEDVRLLKIPLPHRGQLGFWKVKR